MPKNETINFEQHSVNTIKKILQSFKVGDLLTINCTQGQSIYLDGMMATFSTFWPAVWQTSNTERTKIIRRIA